MIKSENGLKWSAIKMEQVLVLFSAFRWRVALLPKEGHQCQKLLRSDNWVLSGSPEPTMVGFRNLVQVCIGPVSKKLALKSPK